MTESTSSGKTWKLLAIASSAVALAALVFAGMLYTRKGIGDVFWPEEKIIGTARTALLKIERDTSLVTTRVYVQAIVRQRNEAWYGNAEVIRIVPATINYAVNLSEIDHGRMFFDEKRHELRVPLPDVKILSIDPDLSKAEIIRNLDFFRMESTTGNQLEDTTEQMIRPEVEKLGQSPEIIKTAKEYAIASVRQLLESALSATGHPVAVQPYFKNEPQTEKQ